MPSIDNDIHEDSSNLNGSDKNESTKESKTITSVVDKDDPSLKRDVEKEEERKREEQFRASPTPGNDPRFQQQNQTLRCYVMYTDYYRCKHILGEKSEACDYFKKVFTVICPRSWIERWDKLREDGRLPWHKYRTQGNFPGSTYGD